MDGQSLEGVIVVWTKISVHGVRRLVIGKRLSKAKGMDQDEEQAEEKTTQPSEVNIAKSDGNIIDCSNYSLSITLSICYSNASEWMLDSDATYKVCPMRERFSSFEKLDGGVVIMGNDYACKIVCIGTIQIKKFDGVVRELTEVRYVPQLKNLISVGALESKGLKKTMKNDILKITKRFMVVMKGVRERNLYYLKGSTVTCVLAGSIGSNDDTSRLWHMRLGHVNEKSL